MVKLLCMVAFQTRVTKANQTQVPAELRARYQIGPGDVVVWEETSHGIQVRFRPRRTLRDLIGIAPGIAGGDSVAAKKRAQRGQR
jgi:bifunctional DNA-binding transcriptional regulator/antitoxin component of YhaV-PrlF toxin-antitoxin module